MALLLCGALGCASAERMARKSRDLVAHGMAKEEVLERLGAPLRITMDGSLGTEEAWHYEVTAPPNAVLLIAGAVLLVAVVAAAVATRGGGGGGLGGGPDAGRTTYRFRVFFNSSERVSGISPLQPLGPR